MTKEKLRSEYNNNQNKFLRFDNENEAYSIKAVRYINWLENKHIELLKLFKKYIEHVEDNNFNNREDFFIYMIDLFYNKFKITKKELKELKEKMQEYGWDI